MAQKVPCFFCSAASLEVVTDGTDPTPTGIVSVDHEGISQIRDHDAAVNHRWLLDEVVLSVPVSSRDLFPASPACMAAEGPSASVATPVFWAVQYPRDVHDKTRDTPEPAILCTTYLALRLDAFS
ncbi:hypothetical protein VTJ04DRAFT_5266 [Mycothermus thermophilus]|uniref:uncharacterized protein n=1 Tax=Humicola insolens TaxID=85995 RepID=UPI003742A2ED